MLLNVLLCSCGMCALDCRYLQELHARYGYKIWLTEFSCGDGAQQRPTADHLQYMREAIPALEQAPFVYR